MLRAQRRAHHGELTPTPVEDCGSQSQLPQKLWYNAETNSPIVTFEDASAAWGFDTPGVSHGMALADLDNDGTLDLIGEIAQGTLDRAKPSLETAEALAEFTAVGNRAGIADVYHLGGTIANQRGDAAAARQRFREDLGLILQRFPGVAAH